MAFEAFLAERRPRPGRSRRFGYLLALLSHAGALALAAAAPHPPRHGLAHAELDGGATGQPVRLWAASVFAPSLPAAPLELHERTSHAEHPTAEESPRSHQGHRARSPRTTIAPVLAAIAPRGQTELPPAAPPDLPPEPDAPAIIDPPRHPAPGAERAPALAARVVSARPEADPPYIPAETARGLRVYEYFPGIPRALARRGSIYPVVLGICVSARGSVTSVSLLRSATPDLDQVVVEAIQSWRYHPFTFEGLALPFCHTIRIVYSVPG